MAIITLGPTITGIRGSIGGSTFSANKAGPYIKAKSRGPNPHTTKQSNSRGKFITPGPAWTALTSAQRTAWNALTAAPPEVVTNSLGETLVLSGFQWFTKIHLRQLAIGATPTANAPTGTTPAQPASTVVYTTVSGGLLYDYPNDYFAANEYFVLFTAIRFSSTAIQTFSQRRLTRYTLTPNQLYEWFTDEYTACWGAPRLGTAVTTSMCKQLQNGLRSIPVVNVQLITA
jgi:hypothetical protein